MAALDRALVERIDPVLDRFGIVEIDTRPRIAWTIRSPPEGFGVRHARQGVERFRVAPLRLLDQSVQHPSLHILGDRPWWLDQ